MDLAPVLAKVFHYLDWKTKKDVRLVCRIWKQELDDTGLYVRIDNRLTGNAEFCSRRVLDKVNVAHIDAKIPYVHLKHASVIKTAKCSGQIQPIWFLMGLIQKCEGLTELHLTGSFLISQEIANVKNVKRGSEIRMDNLKVLHIELGQKECEDYIQLHKPQGFVEILANIILNNNLETSLESMCKIVDTNVTFLLSQIRACHTLHYLYVFVDPMQFLKDDIAKWEAQFVFDNRLAVEFDFEWKRAPIEMFLERHRNSLRELYLPQFGGRNHLQLNAGSVPQTLKTIELTLHQVNAGQPSFMERLIFCQTSLETLKLDNNYTGIDAAEYVPLTLRGTICKNHSTLTYINLTLSSRKTHFLDGATFEVCFSLRTFILEHSHQSNRFSNFNMLPKSLKTIKIHTAVVIKAEEGDHLEIDKFGNLEHLMLSDIHVKPIELQAFTNAIAKTVMLALRSRRLNFLKLDFANEILLIRDDHLLKSILNLGESSACVDIYEPFHLLEISGDHDQDPLEDFLSIEPVKRTCTVPSRMTTSGPQNCALENISIRSNVFTSSRDEVEITCCSGIMAFRFINPAHLDEDLWP